MGIFSTKRRTMVSSVVYSLAGGEEDRIDFIKATALSCAITGDSIGPKIVDGILYGQGAKLRNAHNYARRHYSEGMPVTNFTGMNVSDPLAMTAAIQTLHPGSTVTLLTQKVGPADFTYWAEEYLAQQYGYDRTRGNFDYPPAGVAYNAQVTYDILSNIITITMLSGTSVHTERITAKNWNSNATYAHAAYRTSRQYVEGDNVETRDAKPGDASFTETTESSVTVADETFTRVTTITGSLSGDKFSTRTLIEVTVLSRSRYFIYKLGTGTFPALDALEQKSASTSPYFPSLQLREYNNDQFRDQRKEMPVFKTSVKLAKHLGVELLDLVDQINDNENIGDIDFAFMTVGTDVATQTKSGKEYLYKFFEYIQNEQKYGQAEFASWDSLSAAMKSKRQPAVNTLEYYNRNNRKDNYNIKIQWQYISKTLVNGKVKPDAKIGEITSSIGAKNWFDMEQANGFSDVVVDSTNMYMRKQISADTYEEMKIVGLVYSNEVYNGKSVTVTAYEAFRMPEAEGEGFLVPMNMDVYRSMSAVQRTQLAYECNYVIFNCYVVKKRRWYQRGAFKVILVIVAIIITYFSAGAGSYTMALATAIGTVVAVSATVALIIASVVVVLAGIVIGSLLSKGAVALFGEKWGGVIAAIVTIVLTRQANAGTAGAAAASTAQVTAATIIKALGAVQQVYGAYTKGQIAEMQSELDELREKYEKDFKLVNDLLADLQRQGNMFDIDDYMVASQKLSFEGPDDFLSRTLMTGSEVAMMTQAVVDNFADIGLSLNPNA